MMREEKNYTIYKLLRSHAERDPEAPAVVSPGRLPLNYGQLLRRVVRSIEVLDTNGIGRGDRIAIVLPSGLELATVLLSVSSMATSIPLNPAYLGSEFEFFLTDLNPKALIVRSETNSPAITIARQHGIRVLELSSLLEAKAGNFNLTTPAIDFPDTQNFAEAEDVALVLYTSGTTSKPKRVPLTQKNLVASAGNISASLQLTPADRCLNIMPLFHIHGLVGGVLSSLFAGASVAIPPEFDSTLFLDWLDEIRPTWYTAVPPMHHAILKRACERPDHRRFASLRFIRSSSAPLPVKLMAELEKNFEVPVIEAYGMTEAAHQIASNPLLPFKRKPGSVGRPTGTEVAIMDERGSLIPPSRIGEIVLRGAQITRGYESNAEANTESFLDGWFRTGDQGYFDNDGYLFLTGRFKETINRGGEKIAPLDVETVLSRHDAIAEIVVFPVPHKTLGEEVAAAVVLNENRSVTEGDLLKFAASHLVDFKIPRRFEIVDRIPRSPTGKVRRSNLASQLGLEPDVFSTGEARAEFVEPRNELETQLATIWSRVLRLERFSVFDNFFYLGGDSITAAEVILEIRRTLGEDLSFLGFFEAPTVADMAKSIASHRQAKLWQGSRAEKEFSKSHEGVFYFLIELQRGKHRDPIFFFPGGEGNETEFFIFMRITRHMGPDYPIYSFRARGTDGATEPHASIEEMATDYIAEIQKLQPHGPYFFIGECIGGALAYEAARQLTTRGYKIAALILLDTLCPTRVSYFGYRFGRFVKTALAAQARRNIFKRILYHKTEVLRRNPGQWLSYFLRVARRGFLQAPRPYWQSHSSLRSFEAIARVQRSDKHQAHMQKAGNAYGLNLRRYKPKPYEGMIRLIVNERWFERNPTLGWEKFAAGGVDSFRVPGRHETYIQHNSPSVAEQVKMWLEDPRIYPESVSKTSTAYEPDESTNGYDTRIGDRP